MINIVVKCACYQLIMYRQYPQNVLNKLNNPILSTMMYSQYSLLIIIYLSEFDKTYLLRARFCVPLQACVGKISGEGSWGTVLDTCAR